MNGFCHMNRIIVWGEFIYSICGGNMLRKIKTCPQCDADLNDTPGPHQVCNNCGYWTKKGTVRFDSVMILA